MDMTRRTALAVLASALTPGLGRTRAEADPPGPAITVYKSPT